jgi:hypothetical protein
MTSTEREGLRRELHAQIARNLHRLRFWPLCLLAMAVATTTLMVANALALQVVCMLVVGACMGGAAYELIKEQWEQAALYLFVFTGFAAGSLGYLFHGGDRTAIIAVMSLYFTIISFGFVIYRADRPRR